jgi:hypothetical protein
MVREQVQTDYDAQVSRVRIDDIRRAGYCVAGAREWFLRHDLDFRAFIKHGIDEAELLARGDVIAAEVVRRKHEQEEKTND